LVAKLKPSPYCLPSFDPESFIGRSNALQKVRNALLPSAGRFLLSGGPGVGKSTLALRFAWDAKNDFAAVVFQACGPRSVEAIIGELADTLKDQLAEDISPLPPERKLRAIKDWLEQRPALLVLDDLWLESDLDGLTKTPLKLQDLLPGPSVSVLFTSRRPSLPWVSFNRRLAVDAFLVEEVEEVFRRHLGEETFQLHRAALLEFAGSVERLPIAVMVGAQLLQSEFGPLDEAARGIALSKLRNQVNDVPGLLRRAIESQGERERSLLAAAAICAPDGFWLPFVLRAAGLDAPAGQAARNNLVNAALLRVLDQEAQKFQLHLLVRAQAREMASPLAPIQKAHASVLEELFTQTERRWRDCARCLAEVVPAVAFLREQGETDRANALAYRGYSTAQGIGELDAAMQMEQWNERFWAGSAAIDARYGLQASYGNQALILRAWGKLDEAMALHKKEEAIGEELGDKDGLQICYGNQALILQAWGKLDEAMALLKKKEAICEELGDKDGLQICYGNQALILKAWGKLDEAMALHKKKEAICEELGNKDSLQRSYGNQAVILQDWGKLDEAMALHKKEEAICQELGDKDGLQASYGNQAVILKAWGRLDEAMALHKKEEAICEELGNRDSLQICYGNQALILKAWGRLDEAMALHKKEEAICGELGNKEGLGFCYWNWGRLARRQGQPDVAQTKLEQALALFTELKMPRQRDAVAADLKGGEPGAATGAGLSH
jgi:tetratricopeptide (TPR) repeat protein